MPALAPHILIYALASIAFILLLALLYLASSLLRVKVALASAKEALSIKEAALSSLQNKLEQNAEKLDANSEAGIALREELAGISREKELLNSALKNSEQKRLHEIEDLTAKNTALAEALARYKAELSSADIRLDDAKNAALQKEDILSSQLKKMQEELAEAKEQHELLDSALKNSEQKRLQEIEDLTAKNTALAEALARYKAELSSADIRLDDAKNAALQKEDILSSQLKKMQEELVLQKEEAKGREQNFARIREEFAEIFHKVTEANLKQQASEFTKAQGLTLKHLQSNLKELQKEIQDDSEKRAKTQGELKGEIKSLLEKTDVVSQSAENLTNALKGSAKVQGDWGEVVLTSLLEQSGLEEGTSYLVQSNIKDESGGNLRPDVVVNLPQGRAVVVDSKVSLTAYERMVNADSEDEKQRALKAHVKSLKSHIDELAHKYHSKRFRAKNARMETGEFTLMFVPIEGALSDALATTPELISYAFSKDVMLVGQMTLFSVLKMIDMMWQSDARDKNRDKIYEALAKLLSKFDGLVEAFDAIGKNIRSLNESYDKAENRLKSGRGNLLKQREDIKGLLKRSKPEIIDLEGEALSSDGVEDTDTLLV